MRIIGHRMAKRDRVDLVRSASDDLHGASKKHLGIGREEFPEGRGSESDSMEEWA